KAVIDISSDSKMTSAEIKRVRELGRLGASTRGEQRKIFESVMDGMQASSQIGKVLQVSRLQGKEAEEKLEKSINGYLRELDETRALNAYELKKRGVSVVIPAYSGDGFKKFRIENSFGESTARFVSQRMRQVIDYQTAARTTTGIPLIFVHEPKKDDEDQLDFVEGFAEDNIVLEDISLKLGDRVEDKGKLMPVYEGDNVTNLKAVIFSSNIYPVLNQNAFYVTNTEESFDSPVMIRHQSYTIEKDRNNPKYLEPRPAHYVLEGEKDILRQLGLDLKEAKTVKDEYQQDKLQVSVPVYVYKLLVEFPPANEGEGLFNEGILANFQNYQNSRNVVTNKYAPIKDNYQEDFAVSFKVFKEDLQRITKGPQGRELISLIRLASHEYFVYAVISRRMDVLRELAPIANLRKEVDRPKMDAVLHAAVKLMRKNGISRDEIDRFQSDMQRIIDMDPVLLSEMISLAVSEPGVVKELSKRPNVLRELAPIIEQGVLSDQRKLTNIIEKATNELKSEERVWREENLKAMRFALEYVTQMEQKMLDYAPSLKGKKSVSKADWQKAMFAVSQTRMVIAEMLTPGNKRVNFYFNSSTSRETNRDLDEFMRHLVGGDATEAFKLLSQEEKEHVLAAIEYFNRNKTAINEGLRVRVQHELRGRFTAAHAGRFGGLKNLFMGRDVFINDFFEQIGREDLAKKSTQEQRVAYTTIHESQGLTKIADHKVHVTDLRNWETWLKEISSRTADKFESSVVTVAFAGLNIPRSALSAAGISGEDLINVNSGIVFDSKRIPKAIIKEGKIAKIIDNSYGMELPIQHPLIKARVKGTIDANGLVTEKLVVTGPRELLAKDESPNTAHEGIIKKINHQWVEELIREVNRQEGLIEVREVYRGDYDNMISSLGTASRPKDNIDLGDIEPDEDDEDKKDGSMFASNGRMKRHIKESILHLADRAVVAIPGRKPFEAGRGLSWSYRAVPLNILPLRGSFSVPYLALPWTKPREVPLSIIPVSFASNINLNLVNLKALDQVTRATAVLSRASEERTNYFSRLFDLLYKMFGYLDIVIDRMIKISKQLNPNRTILCFDLKKEIEIANRPAVNDKGLRSLSRAYNPVSQNTSKNFRLSVADEIGSVVQIKTDTNGLPQDAVWESYYVKKISNPDDAMYGQVFERLVNNFMNAEPGSDWAIFADEVRAGRTNPVWQKVLAEVEARKGAKPTAGAIPPKEEGAEKLGAIPPVAGPVAVNNVSVAGVVAPGKKKEEELKVPEEISFSNPKTVKGRNKGSSVVQIKTDTNGPPQDVVWESYYVKKISNP
ncbi:MAG: hypothetical protein HQL27_05745, partial [Candidatus Omnitrophica bacterium]|nr:hypothetical protein [Candidatus Omnitrophota bacterium]